MEGSSAPERISVIVPAYNYAHFLGETLDNLLRQTYSHWECIIVDDGSTDDTAAVAKEWCGKDSRFRYIWQPNAGLSAARNTGLAQAKGAFIQLLDADDKLCPEKFSTQLALFRLHPEASLVYSEVRFFVTGQPGRYYFSLDLSDTLQMSGVSSLEPYRLYTELVHKNIFVVNAPLIRKELFEKNGGFDIRLRSLEDWDYWNRCLFNGCYFLFDPSPGSYALVRTHGNSMSRNVAVMMESSVLVRRKLSRLIAQLRDKALAKELAELNGRELGYVHGQLSGLYREKGSRYKALLHLWYFARLRREYRHLVKTGLEILFGGKGGRGRSDK